MYKHSLLLISASLQYINSLFTVLPEILYQVRINGKHHATIVNCSIKIHHSSIRKLKHAIPNPIVYRTAQKKPARTNREEAALQTSKQPFVSILIVVTLLFIANRPAGIIFSAFFVVIFLVFARSIKWDTTISRAQARISSGGMKKNPSVCCAQTRKRLKGDQGEVCMTLFETGRKHSVCIQKTESLAKEVLRSFRSLP